MDGSELEEAIARDPDDASVRLVYADWLMQRGDPRGELIVLQHRKLEREALDCLIWHHDHFWGALSRRRELTRHNVWELGFLHSCTFASQGRTPFGEVLDGLDAFLGLHSARYLRRFTIGSLASPETDYKPAIDVIATRTLPALTSLELGVITHPTRSNERYRFGAMAGLSRATPNLTQLTLQSSTDVWLDLAGLVLPRLRELRISTNTSIVALAPLFEAAWPALESLELVGAFDPSRGLATARGLPALRHLRLLLTVRSRVVTALVRGPLGPQLETLDLSGMVLFPEEIAELAAHRAVFERLQRLRVSKRAASDPELRAAYDGELRAPEVGA